MLEKTRDDRHHALWAVVLTTGLRVSEVLGLRWTDIDFDRRQLRVIRKLRRISGRREWSLGERKTEEPTGAAVAANHGRGVEVAPDPAGDGAGSGWKGVSGCRSSVCGTDRHTAATLMRQSGMDLKVVQETLGHASMKLTADTYSHVTPAFKRQAVDDFAAYLGVTGTGDGQKDFSDL